MNKYIKFHEILLESLGVFDFGVKWSSTLRFVMSMITVWTFYITGIFDLTTTMNDFSRFAENFAMLLVGCTGFMKYFTLLYNRKKIKSLRYVVKWIEVSGRELKIDDRSIVDNYDQAGLKFSKNYGLMICVACQAMVLQALPGVFLGHGLQLPFPSVYPFDVNSKARFAITYIHQTVSCYIYVLIYVTHDTWFISLVHHACGHFCLLQDLLEKITDADLEPEKIHEKIATCVRLHQNVFKFSNDIEDVFNVSNLMQFLLSSVAICISGYEAMILGLNEPQLFVKHLSSVCGQIIQLLMFNWCGQLMEEKASSFRSKSLGVAHAISRSSLYKLEIDRQRDLGLILLRAQRPMYLTACGFSNLSLVNFTNLMKTSMSYFTMLRSVQEN